MHRYVLPAHPNIVDVDHPPRIAFRARVAPSAFAILFLRSSLALDSLVSRRALSRDSWSGFDKYYEAAADQVLFLRAACRVDGYDLRTGLCPRLANSSQA